MSFDERMHRLRGWLPTPVPRKGLSPLRWFLLDGNRIAVTAALTAFVFGSLLLMGTIWPFEMQRLLSETNAVENLLNTMLGGIVLLVSVVVSVNSIVLSYDLTSLGTQRERVENAMSFRHDLGQITDTEQSPTEPDGFLRMMAEVIERRARNVEATVEDTDGEYARDVTEYVHHVSRTLDHFEEVLDRAGSARFVVLWLGLEYEYGEHMDRLEYLRNHYSDRTTGETMAAFEELEEGFELFATGREYFKTLYYNREFSQLSRTLLLVSLPAIVIDAATVLAINAQLLPDVWLFGLPPLLTYVAATFTVSLLPFVVLTSFTLRAATVAQRTVSAGPFVLEA